MRITYNDRDVIIKLHREEYDRYTGETIGKSNMDTTDPAAMYRLVKEIIKVVSGMDEFDYRVNKTTITTDHFELEYICRDEIYINVLNQHTPVGILHF